MASNASNSIQKVVGYVRVSTKTQGLSGLGLEAQETAIRAFAASRGWPVVELFREVESGKRSRAVLRQAMRCCEENAGSALVAAKVDRLGRRAVDLMALRDAPFPVLAADMPNADKFTWGVIALVAEREGEAISERTTAALSAVKRRGVPLGSSRVGAFVFDDQAREKALKKRQQGAAEFIERLKPTVLSLRQQGLSLREIGAWLTRHGFKTPRGNSVWWPIQVRKILE